MDRLQADMDLFAAWGILQTTQQPSIAISGPDSNAEASSSTMTEVNATGMEEQTTSGNYTMQNYGHPEEMQGDPTVKSQQPASGKTPMKRSKRSRGVNILALSPH